MYVRVNPKRKKFGGEIYGIFNLGYRSNNILNKLNKFVKIALRPLGRFLLKIPLFRNPRKSLLIAR